MDLRRELLYTVGGLVLLNLLLAVGATGLFVRMGPVIDRIMQENMFSVEAAESILGELALAGDAEVGPDARTRIHGALLRARSNVTEEDEVPLLDQVEMDLEAAFAADPTARERLVVALRALIIVNREAMHSADAEARRLGTAGAWVAVVVGSVSFLLSLAVVSRLRRRLLGPLIELHEVLDEVRGGDRFRRCRSRDAPHEVRRVSAGVNKLLDERFGVLPAPDSDADTA